MVPPDGRLQPVNVPLPPKTNKRSQRGIEHVEVLGPLQESCVFIVEVFFLCPRRVGPQFVILIAF